MLGLKTKLGLRPYSRYKLCLYTTEAATFQGDQSDGTNMNTTQDTSYWVKGSSHSQQGVNAKVNKVLKVVERRGSQSEGFGK